MYDRLAKCRTSFHEKLSNLYNYNCTNAEISCTQTLRSVRAKAPKLKYVQKHTACVSELKRRERVRKKGMIGRRGTKETKEICRHETDREKMNTPPTSKIAGFNKRYVSGKCMCTTNYKGEYETRVKCMAENHRKSKRCAQ